jgi:hypothetical protein
MFEDAAGQQAIAGRDYATCSECGAVFPRTRLSAEPSGLHEGNRSEFTEVCSDCLKLDRQGEQVLLRDPDDL